MRPVFIALPFAALAVVSCLTDDPSSSEPPPQVTVQVSPDSATCVEGDTITFNATVSPDSVSQELLWSSGDDSIASVEDGIVPCNSMGTATITVSWAQNPARRTTVSVTVLPDPFRTFTVQAGFMESDPHADPEGLTATIAWRHPSRDSVTGTLDAEGNVSFSIPTDVADEMDSLTVRVEGSEKHHPARMNFRKIRNNNVVSDDFFPSSEDFYTLLNGIKTHISSPVFPFIHVPTEYTVPLGTGAGQTAPVDIEALYASAYAANIGWMSGPTLRGEADQLPLTLCFVPDSADYLITAEDSVWIWDGIQEMEGATGVQMFQPGTIGNEVIRPGFPGERCDRYWWTDTTLNSNGDVRYGAVRGGTEMLLRYVPSRPEYGQPGNALAGGRRTLQHEAGHLLGFGHTCSWQSVMWAGGCEDTPAGLEWTPGDVRAFHLVRELRLAETVLGGANGALSLDAARQGASLAKPQALARAAVSSEETGDWLCH